MLPQAPNDVLYVDDGVIDDDAEGYHQAGQHHHVERCPPQVEHEPGRHKRKRHRDEADQRGAPLEEKGSDHENYEHGSDDQRRRQVADRLLDEGRGPEDGRVDLHAGKTWAKVVDRVLDAPGYV
jgi:hypothetical protein